MPHFTDKDMTYDEFRNLLKERYEKGESTDEYSYKSNVKKPFTCIIIDDFSSSSDYSELIKKVKTIIENEGLTVTLKQVVGEQYD